MGSTNLDFRSDNSNLSFEMNRQRVSKGTKEALKRVIENSYKEGSADDFISCTKLELHINARLKVIRFGPVSKKLITQTFKLLKLGNSSRDGDRENRGIAGVREQIAKKRKTDTGPLCEQNRVVVGIFESWSDARDNHCLAIQDRFIATNGLSEFQQILDNAINGPVVGNETVVVDILSPVEVERFIAQSEYSAISAVEVE